MFGPQACLEAGKIHERLKDYNSAIQDYEIALKLPSVPDQILVQIRYRAALTYIAMKDIPKGLAMLKQVQALKPNYKDDFVKAIIKAFCSSMDKDEIIKKITVEQLFSSALPSYLFQGNGIFPEPDDRYSELFCLLAL